MFQHSTVHSGPERWHPGVARYLPRDHPLVVLGFSTVLTGPPPPPLSLPPPQPRHPGPEGAQERLSGHQAEQPAVQAGAGGEEHPAGADGRGADRVPAADRHQADAVRRLHLYALHRESLVPV